MIAAGGPGAVMAGEMAEQPRVLRHLVARQDEIDGIVRSAQPLPPRGVVLLARGTSDHAAVFGRYILEATLGVPVGLAAPGLWTRYQRRADLDGHLLVALSQSGKTPEIERVVRLAGAAGATTLALTNEADSPLALAAHATLALHAGVERAVPATKTFTAQVAALALIARSLGRHEIEGLDHLDAVPACQEQLLGDTAIVKALAPQLATARAVVTVASGFLYAIALEAALKLIETTSLPVLSYSSSDFLHGPIAVAAPDVPVICFGTTGPVLPDVQRTAAAAADRGAPVVWVSDQANDASGQQFLSIPAGIPEPLMPLLHAVRAQQVALEVSLALGRDPDRPHGLQKVTVTT